MICKYIGSPKVQTKFSEGRMKHKQKRKIKTKSKKRKTNKEIEIRVRAACTNALRKFLDVSAMSDCHLSESFNREYI